MDKIFALCQYWALSQKAKTKWKLNPHVYSLVFNQRFKISATSGLLIFKQFIVV